MAPMNKRPEPWSIELNCLERVSEALVKAAKGHAAPCACLACTALVAVTLAGNAVGMLAQGLASDWLIDEPADEPPARDTGDGPYRGDRF